jgi:phosphoribosyl 1,2-cyclic phosphodiesterase
MFGFCPLASGSKGNCLYIGGKNTRLLIDVGISVQSVIAKLSEINVNPENLQAILVTHDHVDHIKCVVSFAKKFNIPVLANAETAKGIVKISGERPKFKIFTTGETFAFGEFEVHPFSVPHDTLDPVAFTFKLEGRKMGVCADLGHATSMVKKCLQGCDYLYLEANHEPSMVHASKRPNYLKERILGRQGHLSNIDCGKLLLELMHPGLKHVHLAHLSGECNTEEVALKVVKEVVKEESLQFSIAYQDRISKAISF